VEYNKRTEHINPPVAEQEMTNLLVRLSRTNNQPVMYLDGHGERNLLGVKNFDIGEFGKQLEKKGFKFANPDLTIAQGVPSNGAMLVIASPQVDVSEVEAKKIKAYIEAGGNVLWLLDDNNVRGLKEVADYLGLSISPGIVVDKSASQYGADPKVAFASNYGDHAITKNFMLRTLFPEAHEIDAKASFELGWKVARLVDVAPNGWLESDVIPHDAKNLKVSYDKSKDKAGPINIGVALEREYGKKGQRIVVMGNANFLSNTFITNGGNLDLGINIINWLAGDDKLITIQPMPLKDINVTIPSDDKGRLVAWMVFHGFQYFIPLGFFVTGFYLWWKRRKA
ncbi:MAG TPA: ABC transporter, partial [Methylophilaceae bacterium]|nr:ABC transporter [Methylophilaceae bacterium]